MAGSWGSQMLCSVTLTHSGVSVNFLLRRCLHRRHAPEYKAIVTQLRSAWDDQDLIDRDRGSKSSVKGRTVHFAEADTEWYAEQIAHSISGDAAELDVTWSFDPDESIWWSGVLDPSIPEPDVVDWSEDWSNHESSSCAESSYSCRTPRDWAGRGTGLRCRTCLPRCTGSDALTRPFTTPTSTRTAKNQTTSGWRKRNSASVLVTMCGYVWRVRRIRRKPKSGHVEEFSTWEGTRGANLVPSGHRRKAATRRTKEEHR